MSCVRHALKTYRLRLRRKRFLYRAALKSRQITPLHLRVEAIRPKDILCFITLRNEVERLPFWLDYYRKLGVNHFLVVDNASDDGSAQFLSKQPDVSLWQTHHSYKLSRFGMDWLTWLQWRYAHGHWALTLDADEILVYPQSDTRGLRDLTAWLNARQIPSFGAVMLDMYPKGSLFETAYCAGDDPRVALPWFDNFNLRQTYDPRFERMWVQGGVRERVFFKERPERAPTLNKVPLVKWQRGFSYVSSTHHALPARLNHVFPEGGAEGVAPTGVLLHNKFLPNIRAKSLEEQNRQQHFENSALYDDYYARVIEGGSLWTQDSVLYQSPQQLEKLGFMSSGGWS